MCEDGGRRQVWEVQWIICGLLGRWRLTNVPLYRGRASARPWHKCHRSNLAFHPLLLSSSTSHLKSLELELRQRVTEGRAATHQKKNINYTCTPGPLFLPPRPPWQDADKSAFSQIIGKIIDIKKLNLEFIDQIINIGKCIEFDPIYTRKTKPCYFVLLKSFLQLLNAVQRFLQPFRAVLANLISKLDFLT